jgi:hypothetical protein
MTEICVCQPIRQLAYDDRYVYHISDPWILHPN